MRYCCRTTVTFIIKKYEGFAEYYTSEVKSRLVVNSNILRVVKFLDICNINGNYCRYKIKINTGFYKSNTIIIIFYSISVDL